MKLSIMWINLLEVSNNFLKLPYRLAIGYSVVEGKTCNKHKTLDLIVKCRKRGTSICKLVKVWSYW